MSDVSCFLAPPREEYRRPGAGLGAATLAR